MSTKKPDHNDVISWAEARVREMKRAQVKNRKDNTLVTIILAIINITIIAMASIALIILLKFRNDSAVNTKSITMASIAASLTIIIFFVNVANIVYRSVMRLQTYKNAADAIQHEVARFHLHDEYKEYKDPEQVFIDKIKEIEDAANHTKRKKSIFKIILKALSGGENV